MNDFLGLEISGSGMRAQRERMRVIAENLANQHTTGPDGPYKRKDVVFESVMIEAIEANAGATEPVQAVQATGIAQDSSPPLRVYEPSHPHADAEGYVAYPNVSIFREMTDMIESSRAYEANLAAANANQDMLLKALDLLGK